MAQFAPALDFVLNNEDRQRQYAIVPDTGGLAIAGINSHAYPVDFAAIAALPQPSRGAAVSSFYLKNFWNPLNIGGLTLQDLANRVMDESVNGGLRTGAVMLQRVANSCGASPQLTVDGEIGALTLEAVNAIDPERILAAYRAARVALYAAIAQVHPEDAKYLEAWDARASA